MRVWRLARSIYPPLDGEGARRYGGRWNSEGRPVVYTSSSLSLAVLEALVHTDSDLLGRELSVFEIEIPEALSIARIDEATLPSSWHRTPAPSGCQEVGDAWIAGGRSAVLDVPSVLVPIERNLLINPRHADAAMIQVIRTEPFRFDQRLLSRGVAANHPRPEPHRPRRSQS